MTSPAPRRQPRWPRSLERSQETLGLLPAAGHEGARRPQTHHADRVIGLPQVRGELEACVEVRFERWPISELDMIVEAPEVSVERQAEIVSRFRDPDLLVGDDEPLARIAGGPERQTLRVERPSQALRSAEAPGHRDRAPSQVQPPGLLLRRHVERDGELGEQLDVQLRVLVAPGGERFLEQRDVHRVDVSEFAEQGSRREAERRSTELLPCAAPPRTLGRPQERVPGTCDVAGQTQRIPEGK